MTAGSLVEKIFVVLEGEPRGLNPNGVHSKLMYYWKELLYENGLAKIKTKKSIQRHLRTNEAFVELSNGNYIINNKGNFSVNPEIRKALKSSSVARSRTLDEIEGFLKDADGPVDIQEIVQWANLPRLKVLKWLAENKHVSRVNSNLYSYQP